MAGALLGLKLLNIFLVAHGKNKFKRMLSFGTSCGKKALS